MFGLSAWHLAILVVVGLFVFGPERLPTMIRDLGKALRQVRAAANTMQEDLKAELGPEVGDLDLRSLHPRTFVEKHLFGEEEDPLGLDFLRNDDLLGDKPSLQKSNGANGHNGTKANLEKPVEAPVLEKPVAPSAPAPAHELRYDADAT